MWVVRRNEDGAFVHRSPVTSASYTRDLTKARTFASKEAAQRECCGNEHPISVYEIMQGNGQ